MVYIALCTDKMIRVVGQMQAQQTEQKGLGHCTSAKSLFTEKRKMVKINTNRSGVALLFKKAKFRNSLRLQSSSARLLPLAVQAFPPLPPPPPDNASYCHTVYCSFKLHLQRVQKKTLATMVAETLGESTVQTK